MTDDDHPAARTSLGSRALRIEQESSQGMDQGMRVLSYLLGGVACYGLLGWLADHLLGTRFLLPVGIVGGAALAVYVIIRRFGQVPVAPGAPVPPGLTTHPARADLDQSDPTEGAK